MVSAAVDIQPRAQRQPLVEPGQIAHHVGDMAVTVAADVPLATLQARLAESGQWLPIDGEAEVPVGQLVLHDSTGPLRAGYGAWRDLLMGVQFTDGRGGLVTTGGVTVKNVAGYDLVKFLAGSHGAFGTPVSLTCRTYRRPEVSLTGTLAIAPGTAGITKLLASDAPPQWILRTSEGLCAGWLGSEREVNALAPVVTDVLTTGPQRRTLAEDESLRRTALPDTRERLKLIVPPARLENLIRQARPARYAADPVFGVLWMPVPERFDELMSLVKSESGHAVWVGRDGIKVFGVDTAARHILANLKKRLDPDNRLPRLPIEE